MNNMATPHATAVHRRQFSSECLESVRNYKQLLRRSTFLYICVNKLAMKVKSVADKINEELNISSGEDTDENEAKVVDFDEYDIPRSGNSDIRKRNVKLLSEQSNRYKGKLVSRKDVDLGESSNEEYQSSNEGEDEESSMVEEDNSLEDYNSDGSGVDDSEIDDQSEMEGEDESEEDESDDESLDLTEDNNEDAIAESKRQEAEVQKGICVQNQLRIWERLLEVRIHAQKLLNKSNQLPSHGDQSDYKSDTAKETTENTCVLLKNLLELKTALTAQFSELRSHMKRPLQETSALNTYESGEPPLKRIAAELDNQHNQMRSYRNSVLLKWDDRTKLLTPGAGSKKKIAEEFDVVRKIENALLNRDVLISKTRVIQQFDPHADNDSLEEQTEKEETQKSDPNIYDDSDFYHQQLRELIEYKTNSSSNASEMTKQIIELQKLRQKMKKKVDTRASKGRKIRYAVHNKLVNFMAPDDATSINWPDRSKDELYKSLFAT